MVVDSEQTERKDVFSLSGIQRLLEVGLIAFTGLALFLMLALFTFDPADPGWSQTGFSGDIKNTAGRAGAYLADILLFVFGYFAFVIPVAIAGFGWLLFRRTYSITNMDFLTAGLRFIGVVLTIIGATSISSMNFDDIFNFSSGGIIGDVVSGALLPYFNFVGSTLLLLCFFFTGLTLATGVSWITVVDSLGEVIITGSEFVFGRVKSFYQRFMVDKPKENGFAHAVKDMVKAEQKKMSESKPSLFFNEENSAHTYSKDKDGMTKPAPVKNETIKVDQRKVVKKEPIIAEELDFDMPFPTEDSQAASLVNSPEIKQALPPLPCFSLLDKAEKSANPISQEELDEASRLLEAKLLDFNVEANVVGVCPGPVITRFELDLAPGVKVAKVVGLSKDLARALSARSVRVVEVIPGKSVIGLELPNLHRETVQLSEVIVSDKFSESKSPLTMVLGADISGNPVVVDLAKMPHLLVAGTTGSGKSVGVNTMILSLLYKSTPEDVRLIMIDPKMLELSVYEGIPHLLAEVVTDMKDASNALRWCVGEMERRYRLMSALGVRNLKGYNAKVLEAKETGQAIVDPLWNPELHFGENAPELEKLPAIVVVVDEFADMMMIVGKKVEELIARIAQKARAAGIHLILATQRPSVDVITGLIKANIPTRIAFQVSTKIDSRTILDQQGAESLLGMGDMLYLPPGSGVPTRVHGAFVDDHEVHAVVADWKKRGEPNYLEEILSGDQSAETLLPGEQMELMDGEEADELYDEAVEFVTETRKVSVSSVQRKFRIGYNRAARIVEQMELTGVVSPAENNGNRTVLAPPPIKD